VRWRAGEISGEQGDQTPHAVDFDSSALALTVYSRFRMSPALHWHLHLLGQLLGEFYMAKQREEKLRQQSYVQAVHETGARMTHDIKNLLQSLNVLCSVAAQEGNRDSPELQALMRRQLPVIAQRLSATLEKLQRPQDEGETFVPAQAWWLGLSRQYRGEGVEFELGALPHKARVPRSLFDSAADNLIRNALAKRHSEGHIRVRALLEGNGAEGSGSLRFVVRDSGSAIPPDIAAGLLRAPVASRGGLGIGLYQAARQAHAAGFSLSLEENRDGEVRFALSGSAV
jgi:signal transduction histidine kinase